MSSRGNGFLLSHLPDGRCHGKNTKSPKLSDQETFNNKRSEAKPFVRLPGRAEDSLRTNVVLSGERRSTTQRVAETSNNDNQHAT
jgi:hypothetical protein